jgi:branched-subunit amino acid transport protein
VTLTYTQVWVLILGCAALTALIKALGPVLLGGRELPSWFSRIIVLRLSHLSPLSMRPVPG